MLLQFIKLFLDLHLHAVVRFLAIGLNSFLSPGSCFSVGVPSEVQRPRYPSPKEILGVTPLESSRQSAAQSQSRFYHRIEDHPFLERLYLKTHAALEMEQTFARRQRDLPVRHV